MYSAKKGRKIQKSVGPLQVYKYFFTQKYSQRGISFEITGNALRPAHGRNKSEWIEIDLPSLDYASETIKTVTIAYDKVSTKVWSANFTHAVSCKELRVSSRTSVLNYQDAFSL